MAERKAMMDSTHALSISRQARLAGISRGSVYYVPKTVGAADLVLMRHLDALHLEHPFMGTRMLRDQLNREGFTVGRTHVRSLMARRGMEALYRKPGTSKKHPGHDMYPYLLRGLTINRANQVWALDTTYIPMAKGFVYLTAVVDWASRKVLAATVAITLETCHAGDVLQEAFTRYGIPEMVNTDQGSQFSAQEFVHAVKEQGCKFSMDGRGAWRDNVFVERLWKSVKYERVYLHAYDSVIEARQSIMQYMDWYNQSRPHSSLDKPTPDEAYAVMLPTGKLAA
jgi:putative transposase